MPNIPAWDDSSQLVDTELPIETGFLEEIGTEQPTKNYQAAYIETYDYVDSHPYDGYGSTTNFVNMRSSSSLFATLTEAPTFTSTIDNKYSWSPWMSEDYSTTDWCEVEYEDHKDFKYEENWGHGGAYSSYAGVNGDLGAVDSGAILSPTYDLSSAGYFVFSVYILDSLLAHDYEMRVYFLDNTGHYDWMFNWNHCETPDEDGWRYKELLTNQAQYLYDGFRVKYQVSDINLAQATGVDEHKIVAYGSNRINQRYSFSNVDYDEYRVEYLAIELDASVDEFLNFEVYYNSAWNPVGSISAAGTSYLNIHPYLTSSTLSVRVTDSIQNNDYLTQTWRIEEMYLRLYDHIPTSYKMPMCDSLYDTDNIYAMKTPRSGSGDFYAHINTYHSDGDGFSDIQYCYIGGYNGDIMLWQLRYSSATDSYSLITGGSYIGLATGTEVQSGDTLVITWQIEFKFTHPDIANMDIRVITRDQYSQMTTTCDTNWDVETRLQSVLELDDAGSNSRGEINGLLSASGAVSYYGSLQYPPDNAVDIYIISPEVSTSPWSALYDNDMYGAQYWTWVTADDQVGLDYYRSKVVEVGTGSDGIDLLATDDSVSYISDRITVLGYTVSDARVNVNSNSQIDVTLEYEYDNTAVITGTVQINGQNATHIADGLWKLTKSQSTVIEETFDSVEVNSDIYGITVVNQDSQAISVIWDGLIITMSGPADSRINIGETATGITASAIYSYDGTSYDGTLVLNSTTYTYGTVGMRGYTVTSASGDSFDITTILSNDATTCIWDGLIITVTDPDDARINVGDTATGITASAVYAYDGTSYDGNLVLNSTTYVYNTVGRRGYTVISASGDSYNITAFLSNTVMWCIWDEIEVISLESSAWNLVNESFQIWCNLQLVYDNHMLGAGDTVVIADQIATWNGSYFIVEISYPTTGDRVFFVNSTIESTYGITLLGHTESWLVHVTVIPSIVNIVSDFEANDGLYQGVYSEAPLWIHWDPVNDPTPPSFIFTVEGEYIVNWNVTSSWSNIVLTYDNSTGTFICALEIGLPYSDSNHSYTLFVVNEAGYSITRFVYITVRDYTVPVMVSNPDDINMVEGDTGFSIIWTCSDANPDSFEITLDGEIYDSGAWTESIENFTVDLNGFEPGEYIFEITISDDIGNTVQDSVTVVVNESPTTTTSTTDTTTDDTTTNTNTTGTGTGDYLTITIVAMFGGVVVIIIIIVIFMKKK